MATVYLSRPPSIPVYDAFGGAMHDPSNWVEVAPGKWALSGSGEATNYDPNAPVVDPDAAWMAAQQAKAQARPQQQSSPHFNPALAKAYAASNPLLGQEFLGPGEAGLNRGFNPDIAALLGMPVTTGWNYGAPPGNVDPGWVSPAPAAPGATTGPVGGQTTAPAATAANPNAPFDPGDNVLANAVARARMGQDASSALSILARKAKLPKRASGWAAGIGRF